MTSHLVTIWLLNFGNDLTWFDTLGSSWLLERIILMWPDYARFTFGICPHYSKCSSPEVDLHHYRFFKICFTYSAWKSCLIMHYKQSPLCITNIILGFWWPFSEFALFIPWVWHFTWKSHLECLFIWNLISDSL